MKHFKELIFIMLVPMFSIVPAFAGGGDAVNNGGGASELTVVYTYQNYGSLVEVCTRTASCDLTTSEHRLLSQLVAHLPQEQAVPLEFKSAADLGPQLFSTGVIVASPIQINRDLLFKIDLLGAIESYSLSDALELLTLAWSQHHPHAAKADQISLAKKLTTHALVGKASYLPSLLSTNLRLLTIQNQKMDQMYLDDGYDAFVDIHRSILQMLPCQVAEFSVYSFQWSPMQLHEGSKTRVLLNGRIGWKCDDLEMTAYTASLGVSFLMEPAPPRTDSLYDPKIGTLKMVDQPVELNISNIKQAF